MEVTATLPELSEWTLILIAPLAGGFDVFDVFSYFNLHS